MTKNEYKQCPQCGTQSAKDAMFCIKCGYNLKDEPIKVHVENGLFFKNKSTNKLILFSSVPTQYKIVGPVLARISFSSHMNEDYSAYMEQLMDKIQEVAEVNELDGVANLKITSSNFITNDIETVTLIASGDGIKTTVFSD